SESGEKIRAYAFQRLGLVRLVHEVAQGSVSQAGIRVLRQVQSRAGGNRLSQAQTSASGAAGGQSTTGRAIQGAGVSHVAPARRRGNEPRPDQLRAGWDESFSCGGGETHSSAA